MISSFIYCYLAREDKTGIVYVMLAQRKLFAGYNTTIVKKTNWLNFTYQSWFGIKLFFVPCLSMLPAVDYQSNGKGGGSDTHTSFSVRI